jgi:hypothetical protein
VSLVLGVFNINATGRLPGAWPCPGSGQRPKLDACPTRLFGRCPKQDARPTRFLGWFPRQDARPARVFGRVPKTRHPPYSGFRAGVTKRSGGRPPGPVGGLGNFTTNLATALCLSFLPATHPRSRCSTETSLRRPYISATAPSSSVSSTCKRESGSTQLGVPTREKFYNKLCHCPLASAFVSVALPERPSNPVLA